MTRLSWKKNGNSNGNGCITKELVAGHRTLQAKISDNNTDEHVALYTLEIIDVSSRIVLESIILGSLLFAKQRAKNELAGFGVVFTQEVRTGDSLLDLNTSQPEGTVSDLLTNTNWVM
jgi:hypothetical protein